MKRIISILPVYITVLFFFLNTATAQWVKVGNDFGGEVQCFASSGTNIFAGSDGGGVFVSGNNGITWSPINTGLANLHVHALIASDLNLLAGTSGGVYVSSNGGALWFALNTGLTDTTIVHALIENGQSLIAGTSHGVYRGTVLSNWEKIDAGMTGDFYINTFIGSDTNLLAGAFDFGAWRSTDNGSHWDQSNSGLTRSDMHSFAEFTNELYVATDGPSMFVSDDNGHTWGEISVAFQANSLNNLLSYSSPIFGKDQLFIASDNGIYRTIDKAADWTNVSTGLTNLDTRVLFQNSGFLFAAIGDSTVWRIQVPEVSVKVNGQPSFTIKNYPNPFSDKTTINFTSSEHGFAEITIVNILGEEVATVFSGELEAGEHSFIWDAGNMADEMYECIITASGHSQVLPIMKIR
jgi:photosystem II stability/assembly factor-like uncharacterized protein